MSAALTGYIDTAQVVLYVFWVFFAGLIFYIRQEDRREGYPLESEVDGKPLDTGVIWVPSAKSFRLESGQTVHAPDNARADLRPIPGEPVAGWPGAPYEPDGNPMGQSIGPGSWAERADLPDLATDGKPKIVPLRVAGDFHIEPRDPDPRGMTVLGADGETAGEVVDAWVDRAEYLLRYYEVRLGDGEGAKTVLLPVNFSTMSASARTLTVRSILAAQFAGVPALASPDQITFLEEEKVTAYYGSGTLYATPDRAEPLL